jgi:diacylglycerol kinase (ATP)
VGKAGATGVKRVIDAAGYSMRGLSAAFKNEAAFRQELALAVILAPVAFYVGQSNIERTILIASLLLVLIVELLNSAIEAVVDRISDEHHELSGRAKDIGSAAVFVSLANVVVVWTMVIFT